MKYAIRWRQLNPPVPDFWAYDWELALGESCKLAIIWITFWQVIIWLFTA